MAAPRGVLGFDRAESYRIISDMATSSKQMAKRVASRVQEARAMRNLTQREAARRLKIEPANWSRLESGKHLPDTMTLIRLAEVLELPLADLVSSEEPGWAMARVHSATRS